MEEHNILAKNVVDAAYQIHIQMGPGLLESVYEKIMAYELRERGILVDQQIAIPIEYNGVELDAGFRADLVVDGKVIVELKALEHVADIHKKQLLTYLRLSGMRLGLLINFGELFIKNGITRIANGL